MKVSDDSKEQTNEDDKVDDTDIDKIFSEMLMPPPVSAILMTPRITEDANIFSEQLVGFQTSQKFQSDDSKEQSNENVEKVHEANDTDDKVKVSDDIKNQTNETRPSETKKANFDASKNQTNETQHSKAKKANYDVSKNQTNETQPSEAKKTKDESPIISENKAIPQALDNSLNNLVPLSNLPHDNDGDQDIYDSYGNYVLSNIEGVAGDAYFGTNEGFQGLLSDNPLENGEKPLPNLSEEANNLLDQLVKFETSLEMHSNDSMKGSDDFQDQIKEIQFPRDKPFVIPEGIDIYEFEELINANDSVKGSDDSNEQSINEEVFNDTDGNSKGSDDSNEQSIKEEDFNDTKDNLKGSDDSHDQTNETHPPRAKKAKIEEVFSIRRKLEKMAKSGEHGQALNLLEKLVNMDINLEILKDTMIGFTVQALKKSSTEREIILKSKNLIKVSTFKAKIKFFFSNLSAGTTLEGEFGGSEKRNGHSITNSPLGINILTWSLICSCCF